MRIFDFKYKISIKVNILVEAKPKSLLWTHFGSQWKIKSIVSKSLVELTINWICTVCRIPPQLWLEAMKRFYLNTNFGILFTLKCLAVVVCADFIFDAHCKILQIAHTPKIHKRTGHSYSKCPLEICAVSRSIQWTDLQTEPSMCRFHLRLSHFNLFT